MDYTHVKLKDPEGGFFDSGTGFTLARSQVVPWPERPGTRTAEAKRAGVLVPCFDDGSTERPPERRPDPEPVQEPKPGPSLDERIEQLRAECTVKELRQRCKAAGQAFTKRDNEAALATMLAVHEGEGE